MNWLLLFLGSLNLAAWASTVLLARAAVVKPRIGALTERTIIASLISSYGSASLAFTSVLPVSVRLVILTDDPLLLAVIAAARWTYAISLTLILLVPVAWLVLYAFDRLGDK